MTPKVRTSVVYIKQWCLDNMLRMRHAALHLLSLIHI